MGNLYWKGLKRLVLVAGHAIYASGGYDDLAEDGNWILRDFQKGEPPFYIEHIRHGVEAAGADGDSLLVFSGGQTRIEAGPRSEAQSYWLVADHYAWWQRAEVKPRATTEEFARDSFENLLFGICRFFECAGRYPEKVTVVSWAFKSRRFDLHREAISFPREGFEFKGVNDPVNIEEVARGEQRALALFEADPYGAGEILGGKREARNPFNRVHPYGGSNPLLATLLGYKGRDLLRDFRVEICE